MFSHIVLQVLTIQDDTDEVLLSDKKGGQLNQQWKREELDTDEGWFTLYNEEFDRYLSVDCDDVASEICGKSKDHP